MTTSNKFSQALNISLWIAQVLLAITLLWAAYVKLFQPTEAAAMWPWAGEVSSAFLKLTGIVDLLGGLGLILPAWPRIKPILTPIAALGIIALMICAIVFHLLRGERSNIAPNFIFAAIAAFIAWGRFTKAAIR